MVPITVLEQNSRPNSPASETLSDINHVSSECDLQSAPAIKSVKPMKQPFLSLKQKLQLAKDKGEHIHQLTGKIMIV